MKEEFIGNVVSIKFNKKQHIGKIIDETKNTLKILIEEKQKTFIKKLIEIEYQGKIIQGTKITKRPEDRIKK